MTHRGRGTWIAIGLTGVLGFGAWAQPPSGGASRPKAAPEPAVATVGGTRISRAALEQRVREAEAAYSQRSSTSVPPELRAMLRRQVLEGLIREDLLVLEAKRRGMSLNAEQAEEELKKDPFFQRDGIFDEAKYLAVKSTQPDQYRAALDHIVTTLPALRLKEELERQARPDVRKIQAAVERKLTNVTIDYVALRRGSFPPDVVQPTERQVLDFYRAHLSEFVVPEQVVVTLVKVKFPPLSVEERASASAVQSWGTRMRARAESLQTAVKGGASLEELAPAFGDLQTGVTLDRDHFPPDWHGNERARRAVFSTGPGKVLDEVVPAQPGFFVTRVDRRIPERTASLGEVTGTVRARLREQLMRTRDDTDLRGLYEGMRDSLRGPAFRIRYAVADTGEVRVAEPSSADIDRFYRGHLADYSFFDPKTSSVGSRPLSEVRDEVRARLLQERRTAEARAVAEKLLASWQAGKRDAKLERSLGGVREVGPVPAGGQVDTGLVGRVLTDTLASRHGLQVDWARTPRGWVVFHLFAEEPAYVPTFEQALPLLSPRLAPLRRYREDEAVHRFFEENPGRFASGRTVRFSRLMVNPPEVLKIQLTRAEVERFYQSKLADYGAPELVHARHILIVPRDESAEADSEAREKAAGLMRRIQAGESFADLARRYSEDDETRAKGGDLGVFRHGMMLEDFERVAFDMKPGDLRGPVKTQLGYHIIECQEHVPAEVTPLKYAYGTVAGDLARQKSFQIARLRADSLRRTLKSREEARRISLKMGFSVFQNDIATTAVTAGGSLGDYFNRMRGLKPGQFDSEVQEYPGMGYAVSWVDSILPAQPPTWEVAREAARTAYQQEMERRAIQRKAAELDSMMKAGWSFDSLATLFGGLEHLGPTGPGTSLELLSGSDLLDSLAFGTDTSPPVLQPGQPTGWIEFPGGLAMMRLVERTPPDAAERANRIETATNAAMERKLRIVYDRIKQRFPVEILDPELRFVELPPIPDL